MEIFEYFISFLEDKLPLTTEISYQVGASLSQADREAIPLAKLIRVVKNSVFADLLSETYGIEISKLTFIIHSKAWHHPELSATKNDNPKLEEALNRIIALSQSLS